MKDKQNLRIKDLSRENRPRERLASQGPKALTDGELLAILLGTGSGKQSAIDLGNEMLQKLGGLNGLAKVDLATLKTLDGVGNAKASQVVAVMELAARLATEEIKSKTTVFTPDDVAQILLPDLSKRTQEVFVVVLLNSRNHLIATEELYKGAQNGSTVRVSEIFTTAVRLSAMNIIIAHNHPSGDATESPEDVNLTRQVIEAGNILDIKVLDHLVIGQKTYTSIRRKHESLWFR
ncbi:MAG: DNA repair protein RadC [Anaerolineaceae bacterium]